jgi:hypothetical protein
MGAVPGTQTVEVGGFYQHMSDLGLRYGEEFRPIRQLAAGSGRSTGHVVLSEAVAARADEYALHPVLCDGALQVFSAGAATVEDRQARMKLPVRFARILFLRAPGAATRVSAKVQEFAEDFIEGDIALYNESGKPCVLIDGFRAISLAGAGRASTAGGPRDVTYHVAWSACLTIRLDRSPPRWRLRNCRPARRKRSIAFSPRAGCPNWKRLCARLMNWPQPNWRRDFAPWE